MNRMRSIGYLLLLGALALSAGCGNREPRIILERQLSLPTDQRLTWAVAPAVNLSGQPAVDPIRQADLLYEQLQQVQGLTVLPVNRVAEVYAALRIDAVQSAEQAAIICRMLGADALVVPTVTAYHPYNPPRMGAALAVMGSGGIGHATGEPLDPRELIRQAAPRPDEPLATAPEDFLQVVGMFDAANGSTRQELFRYAEGRTGRAGPYGNREFLVSMDRFSGFVYHCLVAELLSPGR